MNIKAKIAALREMTTDQLRAKYAEIFGEPCRSRHKRFIFKRVAWRIQALAYGDLSERARQRAEELANDADLRIRMPADEPEITTLPARRSDGLMVGSQITREYKGRQIAVTVLDRGFEYRGATFKSLSAVAKAVTGSHWNGNLFFGLKREAA